MSSESPFDRALPKDWRRRGTIIVCSIMINFAFDLKDEAAFLRSLKIAIQLLQILFDPKAENEQFQKQLEEIRAT